MNCTLHAMQPEHWPTVSAIYAEGLATGNATFETRVPDWRQWDESHMTACRLVAVRDDEIVGWAALKESTRYEGVAEVSVYVAESARAGGVGRTLLDRLVRDSENAGIWTLQASVFPENEATIRLHEAAGFRRVGIREQIAELHGEWRDTLILERRSDRIGGPAPSDS